MHNIVVLTRDPDGFTARYPKLLQNIEVCGGDVRTFTGEHLGRFTHVIHAAAVLDGKDLVDTMVNGTARVLRFAAANGAKKFLYVSSGAVYGTQPENMDRIPEEYGGAPDTLDPCNAYGNAKRMAEQLCVMESGLEVKIARVFACVGEDLPRRGHFAIGNFLRDALEGKPIRISGSGQPVRSYLYQDDLAAWLLTILEHGAPGTAYNVGSDEAVSLYELASMVARVVGRSRVEVSTGPDYRMRYVPSIRRATTELGLKVWTSLEDAIRRSAGIA